jgi:hypothetical protein
MKIKNCIPNFSKLEITTDNGIITLGKYTLPNTDAFFLKVSEVSFKHELK